MLHFYLNGVLIMELKTYMYLCNTKIQVLGTHVHTYIPPYVHNMYICVSVWISIRMYVHAYILYISHYNMCTYMCLDVCCY